MPGTLYIFIDESGDFNFSKNGSKFYLFTAVMTEDPTAEVRQIKQAQFDILSGQVLSDLDATYLDEHLSTHFHASEDKQPVRDIFFNIISGMETILANSVVVRKNRTNPVLREEKRFYSKFLGSLLAYIFKAYPYTDLCILVNGCAINKNKKIFKQTIAREVRARNSKIKFRILFPAKGSHCHLQIVDYINWAIFRKWEGGDPRSYNIIKGLLQAPERDIFRSGDQEYY